MIFERCTFIIIYIFLSGLSPRVAKAASVILDSTAVQDEIALQHHIPDYLLSKVIALDLPHNFKSRPSSQNLSLELAQKSNSEIDRFAQQSISSGGSLQTEIDRHWALGAMALTSSIAIFLLWLLFKHPQNSSASTKVAVEEEKLAVSDRQSILMPEAAILTSDSESASLSTAKNLSFTEKSSSGNSTVVHLDVAQELIQDLQPEDLQPENKSADKFAPEGQISNQRKAIWKLTQAGDYRSIEPLLKMMPEVPETDRSLIIEAVSKITRRSFKPINQHLFANLQDNNPEVRLNAVRDLKHLYQFVTPAISKIALMQSDPDYQVRQTAIQTLKQLNANPLPTFDKPDAENSASSGIKDLVSGGDSEANLHLVAYLLAELDTESEVNR